MAINNYLSIHLSQEGWEELTRKVRVRPQAMTLEDKGIYYTIRLSLEGIQITFFSPTVY